MTAPKWQPGTIYPRGSVVQPRTSQAQLFEPLKNAAFEAGDLSGWDVIATGAGTASASSGRPYSGTYAARWLGAYGGTGIGGGTFVVLLNQAKCAVVPGQSVTVSAYIAQDDTNDSANYGAVRIYWYTASDTLIKYDQATKVVAGNYSYYENNSLTASAPSNAAYARMGIWLNANGEGGMWADDCGWSTNAPPTALGLIFKAVQPDPGTSAATEPTWPTANGLQVIDNTVTWEATTASYVEWTASPILKSGATEPVWPTTIGEMVSDGTISWECISRRVEDDKCPNSKVVAIMSSKVFAADGDIVRFSATTNPLDWSSADDAGYLPTGLQQANADDLLVLQPYRGNLAAFNASCFQLWQTDPDPALMSLLDQMDGVGSQHTLAACGVGNDLFYLAALGVRSIGIANAAQNMQAGDVGMPVDLLVQAALFASILNSQVPISTYYPSAGQYWLLFNNYPPPDLTLSGDIPSATVGDVASGAYVVSGGVPPYSSITVAAGALPTGITLAPSGSWSGNYTKAGSYSWTVRVTDAIGGVATLEDSAEVGATFLTSTPYPVYTADGIGLAASFAGAETKDVFREAGSDTDAISLSAFFTSAETHDIHWTTDVQDGLSISPFFTSASTKSVLLSTTVPAESLSIAPFFTSASTKAVVLSTAVPAESLSITPFFTSASTESA